MILNLQQDWIRGHCPLKSPVQCHRLRRKDISKQSQTALPVPPWWNMQTSHKTQLIFDRSETLQAPLRPLPPVSPKHRPMASVFTVNPNSWNYDRLLLRNTLWNTNVHLVPRKDESQDKFWMVLIRTTVFNIRLISLLDWATLPSQPWTFKWILVLVIPSMVYHVIRVINFISILKKTTAKKSYLTASNLFNLLFLGLGHCLATDSTDFIMMDLQLTSGRTFSEC